MIVLSAFQRQIFSLFPVPLCNMPYFFCSHFAMHPRENCRHYVISSRGHVHDKHVQSHIINILISLSIVIQSSHLYVSNSKLT